MENYMLPWTDGTANQVLQTDGAGQLSWASLGGGGGADTNFSTTDLTFTADRTHNLDGFGIDIQNGNFGIIASSAFLNAVIPGGFPYYGPYHSNGTALAVNGVRDSTIFGGGIEATGAVTDFATSAESFYRLKSDGVQIGRIESGGVGAAEIILDDDGMDLNLGTIGKHLNMQNLSTYPDDAAADAGGLVPGDVYKTATGELRIKL